MRSGIGKGATHELPLEDELFAVLAAADRLAEKINEYRERAQREAARENVRQHLRSEPPPAAEDAGA